MTSPIVYHPTSYSGYDSHSIGGRLTIKDRVTQAKPFNLSLNYHVVELVNTSYVESCLDPVYPTNLQKHETNPWVDTGKLCDWRLEVHPYFLEQSPYIMNKARANFMTKLGDSVELLTNLAERRQTADLFVKGAQKLAALASAIRRKDFNSVSKMLKVPKQVLPVGHSIADAWLAYWFGIAPLLNDLNDTVGILDDGFVGSMSVSGKAHTDFSKEFKEEYSPGVNLEEKAQGTIFCKIGCKATLVDPNKNLARQLGIVNPIATAWELIPFSFAVDWFINLSQWLNQWTDFFGVELIEPYFMEGCVGSSSLMITNEPVSQTIMSSREFKYANRQTGIPEVSLQVYQFRGLSLSRGASAIAILINQLGHRP